MKHNMNKAMEIEDYLPKRDNEPTGPVHLIQVKIPVPMAKNLRKYLKEHRMTWTDIVRAGLRHFEERIVKK